MLISFWIKTGIFVLSEYVTTMIYNSHWLFFLKPNSLEIPFRISSTDSIHSEVQKSQF